MSLMGSETGVIANVSWRNRGWGLVDETYIVCERTVTLTSDVLVSYYFWSSVVMFAKGHC